MTSLPGSPLVPRKTRAPVTPQQHPRLIRQAQTHVNYSPGTPGSPYTPLSLRSFSSANTSLATPPSVGRSGIADFADNWRVKPKGASRSVVLDAADFADDEDEDDFLSQDEALLPSASLRLRPRAHTYVPPSAPAILRASTRPRENENQSPLVQRTVRVQQLTDLSLTSTPPRNSARANQLRLRGSVTDPAGGRLGNNRQGPDLFHISEDEQEDDDDRSIDTNPEESYFYDDAYMPTTGHNHVPQFYHSNQPALAPTHYPQAFMPAYSGFPSYAQPFQQGIRTSTPPPPGYASHSSQENRQENALQLDKRTSPNVSKPTACSVCGISFSTSEGGKLTLAILSPCNHPLCSSCLTSALNIVGEKDMECAVCRESVDDFKLTTIVVSKEKKQRVLQPHNPVTPSRARAPLGAVDLNSRLPSGPLFAPKRWDELSEDSLSDSPMALRKLKEDVGQSPVDNVLSVSKEGGMDSPDDEFVVLRIDNVPWDITPPVIAEWLGQPVKSIERVHVLLDRKGKTLSHAYVEVKGQEHARRILRGEVGASDACLPKSTNSEVLTPKKRSGVLGKGRRARGVTVTRSSQEELMAALFPSWPGTFSSSRPSLAGLRNDGVRLALERGLMSEGEIGVLIGLIRIGEDSHFLKVPTLPFYSLMSLLTKFPVDRDSRVFWSLGLRDMLFDVTMAAVHTLFSRVREGKKGYDGLAEQVVSVASGCDAFTAEHKNRLQGLLSKTLDSDEEASAADDTIKTPLAPARTDPNNSKDRCNSPAALTDPHPPQSPRQGSPDHPIIQRPASTPPSSATAETFFDLPALCPSSHEDEEVDGEMERLGKEFGVGADVVKALMARLASSKAI